MKLKSDVAFLHPPTTMEADGESAAFWPISDVIPSTPVFEMYPYGFFTMAEYLERHGFDASIRNVALSVLKGDLDVEGFARRLEVGAVAIDLHWLVHASGALELAEAVKRHNPETPVILGGLSSTYFYEELIRRPQVDFLIRGDSSEVPLLELIRRIEGSGALDEVPNLVWKDGGRVVDNGITHVDGDLDHLLDDPGFLPSLVVSGGLKSVPYSGFLSNPIVPVFTVRGCSFNCATCGGGRDFYREHCEREEMAFRSPDRIVSDIAAYRDYGDFPIFLIGDIRQGGGDYWRSVLRGIKGEGLDPNLVLELFSTASGEFYDELEGIDRVNVQLSPETFDEDLRERQRAGFTNRSLEKNVQRASEAGVEKFDFYFMTGLGGQDGVEIERTVRYGKKLAEMDDCAHFFVAPLAPFVDPGSPAFEEPRDYGFELRFEDLGPHMEAMKAETWEDYLNYGTTALGREAIVEHTYDALLDMVGFKRDLGQLDEEEYGEKRLRIELSRKANDRIKAGADPREVLDDVKSGLEPVSTTEELYWGDSRISLRGFLKAVRESVLPF